MKHIKKAIQNLQKKQTLDKEKHLYILPEIFNFFDYYGARPYQNNQINVNPYAFYAEGLTTLIKDRKKMNYLHPLSKIHCLASSNGDWIKQAFVYSSMIRTSSSYDHDDNKEISLDNKDHFKESGTFLKQIFLLPFLKEMGINTLYLLPFFENSTKYKKGAFGSCYAIRNMFELDDMLYDPMLDEMSLHEQAQAFFEACHILNIRVIVDIIPRTSAIDSALIKDHPDWFYWIDAKALASYHPPHYKQINTLIPPSVENMEIVYRDPQTKDFLSHFRYDPKTSDAKKYERLVKHCELHQLDLLQEIKKEYGIVIAPAFSDWINDPQPIWNDVTYLRMYLDNNPLAKCHVNDEHPPYILFDSVKTNLYPCDTENHELWELLSDIVPFYQEHFGIDGVRIDMGHALPLNLVDMIISKAKLQDPDICFIAEELDTSKALVSKQQGYNMILGNGFSEESRIKEGNLRKFYHTVPTLPCPVFALSESHDTARVSAKKGKKELNLMLSTMNLFLPNGVAFLNSGQELFEVQPMNLGLDCREDEQYQLDKSDPRYGKLALFDPFYFSYNHFDHRLITMIERTRDIRREYLPALFDEAKHQPVIFDDTTYALGTYLFTKDKVLLVAINSDLNHRHTFQTDLSLLERNITCINEVYATNQNTSSPIQKENILSLSLAKGEVKLIELK